MTKRPGSGCPANKGLKDRRRDGSSPVPSPEPRPPPGAIWGCQEGPCGDAQGNVSHPVCPPCLCLLPPPCPVPTTHTDTRCATSCPHKLTACSALSPRPVMAAPWHSLHCHTGSTARLSPQPHCSARSLPGHKPPAQPSAWGRNPTHSIPALLPNPRVNPSLLFFFFFSLLSATLDEQSPPLRLPSLTHVVIRSCRYTAIICLVSAFAQTRLANRCGLQLHSLGRAPLHAVTGLPRAAASHFPTLADGGAAGWHMLVLSLPQCSAGWMPSQAFSGFSCLQGRGSGRSKPRGK